MVSPLRSDLYASLRPRSDKLERPEIIKQPILTLRPHRYRRKERMKLPNTKRRAYALWMATLAAGLAGWSALAAAPSLNGSLSLRPLSPSDLKDYALTGKQGASGMSTIGVGQPAYLEALVNIEVPSADVTDVTWTLSGKPVGSKAELTESPLGTGVPVYPPADALVSRIAGRKVLLPDVNGQYTVQASITTASSGTTNVTATITAANYMGLNTCRLCHSGGIGAPDKVTPWSETHHATMMKLSIDGIKSDHYGPNCISCHLVGFDKADTAVNGGFDDVAKQLGYEFPTVFTNGNWDAMPSKLKNLSNIQCESCHGPGSEHASMAVIDADASKKMISTTLSSGNCGQCHDAKTHHKNNAEWNNSGHAIVTRSATGPSRGGCVECHSGAGFAAKMEGKTTLPTHYESITCAACHESHSAANPHQVRTVADVKLLDGKTIIENPGTSGLCMQCHKARRNAETYVETTAGSSHFGPHYSCQTDMLMGANAITYGKIIPSSAHGAAVEDSCVHCHMQSVASTSPAFTHAGGHTFTLKWEGDGTTAPVEITEGCRSCHGPITTFNIKRQDYDEDGVVEGVQDEVEGLLHHLGELLPPEGPEVVITAAYDKQQLKAAYNYQFVHEDGSHGVHNLAYTVGILKASIADLTDDADHDGISDKWELANFGSISVCNGKGDPDGDGVSDALEAAAGTNPNLADSDGDGISDSAEFAAGSDPLNAQDKPGLVMKMHLAGEMEFASEQGKNYQIQAVSELSASWHDIGEKIEGTGDTVTRLVSTKSGGAKMFYRVVQVD